MENKIAAEGVEGKIYLIRGHWVMIDRDLAEIYGVPTGRLNEQVKRNRRKFPNDFMFRLTASDAQNLTFQTGISSLKAETPACMELFEINKDWV